MNPLFSWVLRWGGKFKSEVYLPGNPNRNGFLVIPRAGCGLGMGILAVRQGQGLQAIKEPKTIATYLGKNTQKTFTPEGFFRSPKAEEHALSTFLKNTDLEIFKNPSITTTKTVGATWHTINFREEHKLTIEISKENLYLDGLTLHLAAWVYTETGDTELAYKIIKSTPPIIPNDGIFCCIEELLDRKGNWEEPTPHRPLRWMEVNSRHPNHLICTIYESNGAEQPVAFKYKVSFETKMAATEVYVEPLNGKLDLFLAWANFAGIFQPQEINYIKANKPFLMKNKDAFWVWEQAIH